MNDWLYNKCAELIDYIYGGGMVDAVKYWLDLSATGPFKDIYTFISAMIDIFMGAGVALATIYLVFTLMDRSASQGSSSEMLYRTLIEYVFAIIFILYSLDMVQGAAAIGAAAVEDVQTVLADGGLSSSGTLTTELDAIKNGDSHKWEKAISYIGMLAFTLMLPAICAVIGQVLVIVACMSRGITFIIYGCFTPIAVADVFKDGMRSSGVRYIKKIIALALQGPVILLCVIGSRALQSSLAESTSGATGMLGAFYNLGLTFVTVMLVFKSQSFANDIVGA